MLKLFVFGPAFGEISASPFSVKALCLMEMSGQKYSVERGADPRKAPKNKLPVLEHDGKNIPDSDQIRDYLEATFGLDFDEGLTQEQRGISRAVIRMTEEHIYFGLVCSRWLDDANWPTTREALFGSIPKPIRKFITGKIRKKVATMAYGQGMARHTPQEQADRIGKDIAAIEAILGDNAFLFGDRPSAADASVVAMLREITSYPNPTLLQGLVTSRPTLVAYLERGKEAMYPK